MSDIKYKQVNEENLFVSTASATYKVAAYLRLLQKNGDKDVSDSIVSQRSIIENKVKELGKKFAIVDFYIDDGYSGMLDSRSALNRMIVDFLTNKINMVIVKDINR